MSEFRIIQTFMYPQDAYTAKAFLESEEIDVFLKDEMTTQVFNFSSYALGGVKMLVPSVDADRAIQLLVDGGYIILEEKPTNSIEIISSKTINDKKHCPYCNSSNISMEKKPNWITISIYFLIGLILPITSKTFVCFDCNKKWKFQ